MRNIRVLGPQIVNLKCHGNRSFGDFCSISVKSMISDSDVGVYAGAKSSCSFCQGVALENCFLDRTGSSFHQDLLRRNLEDQMSEKENGTGCSCLKRWCLV